MAALERHLFGVTSHVGHTVMVDTELSVAVRERVKANAFCGHGGPLQTAPRPATHIQDPLTEIEVTLETEVLAEELLEV